MRISNPPICPKENPLPISKVVFGHKFKQMLNFVYTASKLVATLACVGKDISGILVFGT
jgi:hypothetical protein